MQPLRYCRLMTHIGGLLMRPLSLVISWYAHAPCRLHSITLPPSCLHQPPHPSSQGLTLWQAEDAARPQLPCRVQDKLPKSSPSIKLASLHREARTLPQLTTPPATKPRRHTPPVPSSKCRPNRATTLAFLLPFHHPSKQLLVADPQQKTAHASFHHRHQWHTRSTG